jgi:hypothetical protein
VPRYLYDVMNEAGEVRRVAEIRRVGARRSPVVVDGVEYVLVEDGEAIEPGRGRQAVARCQFYLRADATQLCGWQRPGMSGVDYDAGSLSHNDNQQSDPIPTKGTHLRRGYDVEPTPPGVWIGG